MNYKVFLIFTIFSLSYSYSQSEAKFNKLDSVEFYLENSKSNIQLPLEEKLGYAIRAQKLTIGLGIDSTLIECNKNLSDIYLSLNKYDSFKNVNLDNLMLSQKTLDSLSLAKANSNIGLFYRRTLKTDSAYFYYHRAEKVYRSLNEKYEIASTLLSIAIIQKNEKDFIGSEVSSIEAISFLESLEPTNEIIRKKSVIYNNLGIVFGQLEQFEKSIEYFNKSITLKNNLKGDYKRSIDETKNNLANSYRYSDQYDLAIQNYNQILSNKNLIHERPDFYALVLDNYAQTLYLSQDHKELPKLYLKALRICDSIGANYNSIIINHHLAEYYNDYNKKDSALYYAYRAKDISEQYHNDDLLNSLLLLSKIETDSIAVKHYNDYIVLNDSLQKNERNIRNKFARIRFETKEIEQENIQIAREKMWLMILSGALIVTLLLLYIIITQRSKNKELRLVQQQQEANEEIYNLMLSQQDKIEEARTTEKSRISQELHDGVLGRLFGTRLSLDSLNMNTTDEAIKTRGQYIDELKNIEQDIRKVSHELSSDFIMGSGFMDIVKTLVETQTAAYQLEYDLDYSKNIKWDKISNKTKIHIYRIIQESLQNIYKHANATEVKISFLLKNNVICLTINDNGSGFDINKAKKGIGIKNINSRVYEIKGRLAINSEKGVGTSILIEVPS